MITSQVASDTFYMQLALSPYSMRMLFDATRFVIDREKLGKDASPDILCVGVSTPDYVGHLYGPDSREVQELYVHADREIARLIDDLDRRVGRSKYVLVITSDHGVGPIPEVIRRAAEPQHTSVDAGRLRSSEIKSLINTTLTQRFGSPVGGSWVDRVLPPSIYLRDSAFIGMQREVVIDTLVAALRRHPQLAIVATPSAFLAGETVPGADSATVHLIGRSMYPDRSGDVVMYPKRYWIFGSNPATHGTPYDYDRWVPLMMLGNGVRTATASAAVAPVDIAPTLAAILGITLPNVDGRPLPIRRK
jgi:predicted AlkP superfamily pyrophosphatase or phosphodiesterase